MPKYAVLGKDTIKSEIMPYLSVAKRGFSSKFDLVDIVNAILYTLKSGSQWRLLPIGHLFSDEHQAGNHADLYEIENRINELVTQLANAGITVEGLFCDLDAGFDGKMLRCALIGNGIIPNVCPNPRNGGECNEEWLYDEEMYNERWKIERTNAWMNRFQSVLTRFDTTISSWMGWNFLAFSVIFLKIS